MLKARFIVAPKTVGETTRTLDERVAMTGVAMYALVDGSERIGRRIIGAVDGAEV